MNQKNAPVAVVVVVVGAAAMQLLSWSQGCEPDESCDPAVEDCSGDGGAPDGGNPDGGNPDGGDPDGGDPDGGDPDAGRDGGGYDAGSDAAAPDAAVDAGPPGPSTCWQQCTEDTDCCFGGQCGPYPSNDTCDDDGFCLPGQCASDDDCNFGPDVPAACLPVTYHRHAGILQCVTPCTEDADCESIAFECIGVTDDGTLYCVYTGTDQCFDDLSCSYSGGGFCNGGTCECDAEHPCVDQYACR